MKRLTLFVMLLSAVSAVADAQQQDVNEIDGLTTTIDPDRDIYWIVVRALAAPPTTAQAPPAASGPAPVRVGGAIAQPQKIKDVRPVYPADAQSARAQGVVIVEATIGANGTIQDAKVLRSIPLLDAAALEAVRQWEFTPTLLNGVPVPVIMTVTVNFTLDSPSIPAPSSGTAPVPPPAAQSRPVITITNAIGQDGTRYQYEISQERADRLPLWDQRVAPEAPLSMSAARKAAEAWLTARTPEIKTFELASQLFVRMSCGVDRSRVGCWYYRIVLDPVVGGRRLNGGGDFTVVVLLDGSIVEPRVDKPATGAVSGAGGGPAGQGLGSSSVPSGMYRPGNGVTTPRVVREVKPQYTSEAMRAKIQGNVLLEVVVKTDGTVGDVTVVRSLDPTFGLDKEAVKAAKQWRFMPGTRLGKPVPVVIILELTFTLR